MDSSLPELPSLDELESPAASVPEVPTSIADDPPEPLIPTPLPLQEPVVVARTGRVELPTLKPIGAPPAPTKGLDGFKAIGSPDPDPAPAASIPASFESFTPLVIDTHATSEPIPKKVERLVSLDAFRGLIMLLMAAGGFGFLEMREKWPDTIWAKLAPIFDHVAWQGCVLQDLIQPAFMFMVGVAMPFSMAKRRSLGDSNWKLFDHAAIRAAVLILLGVLCTGGAKALQTDWSFANVLCQIGLGYVFLFLLWRMGTWAQVLGIIAILGGYFAWFATTEVSTAGFDLTTSKIPADQWLSGFFGHWTPHLNAAGEFDRWFLNLFRRDTPFMLNTGGYQTLNFVPSLATMTLGLLVGRFLMNEERERSSKFWTLLWWGLALLIAGGLAGEYLCPIVKRIWTPSWVLFSGGLVVLMLAIIYLVVDVWGWKKAAMPFAIVGMNSLFVYLAHQLAGGWFKVKIHQHLGPESLGFDLFEGQFKPVIEHGLVLAILWGLCWWLYRRRAFLSV